MVAGPLKSCNPGREHADDDNPPGGLPFLTRDAVFEASKVQFRTVPSVKHLNLEGMEPDTPSRSAAFAVGL
jgi:hypothetical protein